MACLLKSYQVGEENRSYMNVWCRSAAFVGYAEVESNISQILLGNSYNKKVKEITDELRKDAKIVIK